MTLKVSVVLPVRLDSSRLPNKPLLDVAGKPLLWHVWHNLAGSHVTEIVVASDSTAVTEAVRSWGGKAVLTEGEYSSGTERIGAITHLLREDRVINVQADELTFTSRDLDRFVNEWDRSGAELLTPVYPIVTAAELHDVNTVKVTIGDGGEALSFHREPLPGELAAPVGAAGRLAWGHVGVYGYSKEMLRFYGSLPPSPGEIKERLEQLRFLDNGRTFATYDIGHSRQAINTAADLAQARSRAAP